MVRLVQRQAEGWVRGPLGDQQPEHDDQRHKEEEPGQELLVRVLWCPWGRWWWSAVINVKSCGENTKGKGADSKGHLKSSIAEAKALESPAVFGLWPLSLGSRRGSLSGVLLGRASSPI